MGILDPKDLSEAISRDCGCLAEESRNPGSMDELSCMMKDLMISGFCRRTLMALSGRSYTEIWAGCHKVTRFMRLATHGGFELSEQGWFTLVDFLD